MICTTPRTGGNWLDAELTAAGVGSPGEHLRSLIEEDRCDPAGIRELWESHTQNGLFGIKVHWNEQVKIHRYGLVRAYQYPITEYGVTARSQSPRLMGTDYSIQPYRIDLTDLLPPGRQAFIHLTRDDVEAQARSYAIAWEHGTWFSSSEGFEVSDAEVAAMRSRIEEMSGCWAEWFAYWNIIPLRVTYEQQLNDMPGVVARIADHVNG